LDQENEFESENKPDGIVVSSVKVQRIEMANRISERMEHLRTTGGKSLSVVIMIGDPDIRTTFELVRIAVDIGVDVIELGIPIDKPFLDSDVMRKSMSRALEFSRDHQLYLKTLGKLREGFQDMPFEVMIYHDIVMDIGMDNFCKSLVDTGMDAVLVADGLLKGNEFICTLDEKLLNRGVVPIRFVSHPFNPQQIDDLQKNAHGFIVVQTKADHQGQREALLDENRQVLDEIRGAAIRLPLVLAYGIKTPMDVRKCISLGADGVLIGTAVLEAAHRLTRTGFEDLLINLRKATVSE